MDLGGRYLADRRPTQFRPLALADSSETALHMAGDVMPTGVARYFMFLLSPLYSLARQRPGVRDMSAEQQRQPLQDSHKVPIAPLNLTLTAAFGAEPLLGHWLWVPYVIVWSNDLFEILALEQIPAQ